MRRYKRFMTAEERLDAAKRLKEHPLVERITEGGAIYLKEDFRESLYDAWLLRPYPSTIDKRLVSVGLGRKVTGKEEKSKKLAREFKKRRAKELAEGKLNANDIADSKNTGKCNKTENEEALVEKGILKRGGRGYVLDPEFVELVESHYPDMVPEDILYELDIYPEDVGYHRIHKLKKELEEKFGPVPEPEAEEKIEDEESQSSEMTEAVDVGIVETEAADVPAVENTGEAAGGIQPIYINTSEIVSAVVAETIKLLKSYLPTRASDIVEEQRPDVPETADGDASAGSYDEQDRDLLLGVLNGNIKPTAHPYIVRDENGNEMLSEAFYNEARVLIKYFGIDVILSAYELVSGAYGWLDKEEIRKKIARWLPVEDLPVKSDTMLTYHIRGNRISLMEIAADRCFETIKVAFPVIKPEERKSVCEWISRLPKYPDRRFCTKAILEKCGISKSVYYRYISEKDYGMRLHDRYKQDVRDVRMVAEYKGFKKGSQQIYMLMPRLVGRTMGLNKIRKIMKCEGLQCGIRKVHGGSPDYVKGNKKPNLLRRRFRLFRPNQVRVTDVTYLFYGENQKQVAYGSALMDPVTGRLIAFNVSDYNDLELVIVTLRLSDEYPCEDGGIFHSDQGILYHTEKFQKEVLDRGLNQSMSKRGNCWDNATQESFFGHFKDECDYAKCGTLEELREIIAEYMKYYNEERGLWDRSCMTPIEYEQYLLAMSDEEWGEYMKREEEAYESMKAEAAKKAIESAKNLGMDGVRAGGDK